MTWKELVDIVTNKMVEEQRQQDVAIYVQSQDEFYGNGAINLSITGEETDVLDINSFYLEVDG